MHTYAVNDDICIHHNGGFDGDIIINDKDTLAEIRIDSEDLLAFVASRYVSRKIEELAEGGNDKLMVLLLPLIKHLLEKQQKDRETFEQWWATKVIIYGENQLKGFKQLFREAYELGHEQSTTDSVRRNKEGS